MSEASNIQRAAALVEQGATALRAGNKAQAYTLLREAITLNPNNEHAWLWLAGVVPSDEQRRECLKRVLVINPGNTSAQRGLAALSMSPAPTPVAPPAAPRPAQQMPTAPQPARIFDPLSQAASTTEQATSVRTFDPLAQAVPPTKLTAEQAAEEASLPRLSIPSQELAEPQFENSTTAKHNTNTSAAAFRQSSTRNASNGGNSYKPAPCSKKSKLITAGSAGTYSCPDSACHISILLFQATAKPGPAPQPAAISNTCANTSAAQPNPKQPANPRH